MTDHLDDQEFSAYLDGGLVPRRRAEVQEHVAACGQCRADLAALRLTKQAVASLPEATPPDGWLPSVGSRLTGGPAGEPPRPRPTYRRWPAAVRLAAVAGVMCGALGLGTWLVPAPPAPETFQQQVRQHLVLINDPLVDQTSYLMEVTHR